MNLLEEVHYCYHYSEHHPDHLEHLWVDQFPCRKSYLHPGYFECSLGWSGMGTMNPKSLANSYHLLAQNWAQVWHQQPLVIQTQGFQIHLLCAMAFNFPWFPGRYWKCTPSFADVSLLEGVHGHLTQIKFSPIIQDRPTGLRVTMYSYKHRA